MSFYLHIQLKKMRSCASKSRNAVQEEHDFTWCVLVSSFDKQRLGNNGPHRQWLISMVLIRTCITRCEVTIQWVIVCGTCCINRIWWNKYFVRPLTHLPLVPHICVSKSGQHWLRQWRLNYSAPSHYLNQCWAIVILTLRNTLQWTFKSLMCWAFLRNLYSWKMIL